jgi:hypothetical protein
MQHLRLLTVSHISPRLLSNFFPTGGPVLLPE